MIQTNIIHKINLFKSLGSFLFGKVVCDYREDGVGSNNYEDKPGHIVLPSLRLALLGDEHEVEEAGEEDADRVGANRSHNIEHSFDVID